MEYFMVWVSRVQQIIFIHIFLNSGISRGEDAIIEESTVEDDIGASREGSRTGKTWACVKRLVSVTESNW